MEESSSHINLVMYNPGHRANVIHLKKKYSIPLPNLLLSVTLRSEQNNGETIWKSTPYDCHFYATSLSPLEVPANLSLSDPGIAPVPLPNFYSDCRMCFGENQGIFQFVNRDFTGLEYYFTIVENSPFNNDLSPPNRGGRSNEAWFEYLSTLEEFPYEIIL